MRSLLFTVLLATFGKISQAVLPNYVAEVYFVVDRTVVENYMRESNETSMYAKNQQAIKSIKADVNYFLTEINQLYSTMSTYGLNIQIRSRQLKFLNSDLYSGSEITMKYGLDSFDTWLFGQGSYHDLGYDIAVLWTGRDLVGTGTGDDGTAGYAHLGGVCNRDRASAIVEFDGTYHTVVVTAHEIGHVLGADHDVFDHGYVMDGASSPSSQNRWKFTSASANEIKTFLSQRLFSSNCLQTTNSASSVLSGPVTSALKDPDVICQRSMDSQDSYMCRNPSMYENSVPQGDAVCRAIYCQDTRLFRGDNCRTAYSTDGLTCGKNKICRDGTCQFDSSAGTGDINVDCIWGDIKVFKITVNSEAFEGSCGQFTEKYGKRFCTQSAVSRSCCKTCDIQTDSTSGSNDCPYGDEQRMTVIINGASFTGSCSQFIAQYGQYMCTQPSIKEACCDTCAGTRSRSLPSLSRSMLLSPRSWLNVRSSGLLGFLFRGSRSVGDNVTIIPDVVEEVQYSFDQQ